MRRNIFLTIILGSILTGGATMAMDITSPAFSDGSTIPDKYTCKGVDVSPALNITGAPEGAKSICIIADDPDAPVGTWVHWVVYNLPGDIAILAEDISKTKLLPRGALQGTNDFKKIGYGGPCPPSGPAHRYFFKVYALDTKLNLPAGATKAQVETAMKNHILGQTQLMGKFGR